LRNGCDRRLGAGHMRVCLRQEPTWGGMPLAQPRPARRRAELTPPRGCRHAPGAPVCKDPIPASLPHAPGAVLSANPSRSPTPPTTRASAPVLFLSTRRPRRARHPHHVSAPPAGTARSSPTDRTASSRSLALRSCSGAVLLPVVGQEGCWAHVGPCSAPGHPRAARKDPPHQDDLRRRARPARGPQDLGRVAGTPQFIELSAAQRGPIGAPAPQSRPEPPPKPG
jgi:hypothetical protein